MFTAMFQSEFVTRDPADAAIRRPSSAQAGRGFPLMLKNIPTASQQEVPPRGLCQSRQQLPNLLLSCLNALSG